MKKPVRKIVFIRRMPRVGHKRALPTLAGAALALTVAGVSTIWAQSTSLPERDGEVEIAGQEWPRLPGPRTIHVYVKYPGGALENVTSATGLMLALHNWGGIHADGAPDPGTLANRYNVVAISVDYLQSGKWDASAGLPYDHGYFQALDALRALYYVWNGLKTAEKPFAEGRIFATGGSGGGNVTLMANKLAPRTFACIVDICGMPKLSNDVAFNLPGGSRLDARYSADPDSPRYLNADAQAIRFVGHPDHAAVMKTAGNVTKILIVHGTTDEACLVSGAQEMAANLSAAGLNVEPHFITDADLDGKVLKTTGHSLGDRTAIVFKFADQYLLPDSPDACVREIASDFDRPDEPVAYETPNGRYTISYAQGYPAGAFARR